MSKIRTITAFVRLDRTSYRSQILDAVRMLKYAKSLFLANGFDTQTIRISTQPFTEYTRGMTPQSLVAFFRDYDDLAVGENVNASIGPAIVDDHDDVRQAELLGEILRVTKNLNGSVIVAGQGGVHWKAITAAARLMKFLSVNTENSKGNFRFAAVALVPTLAPFFPGSYHMGAGCQFAVGMQSANVVEAAFRDTEDWESAREALWRAISVQSSAVEALALRVDRETGWAYAGIDVSPAPLRQVSIGAAIENLTKQPVGTSGTLTAAALITGVLKATTVKHAGYSGLMLPVLEDERLAQRWSEGTLSLDALLSYSAVCGTGLDVVPLPGDISESRVRLIIGDVASLSIKLQKPLSARLLPVVGKKAGDVTDFKDPVLVDTVLQPLVSPKGEP